MPALSSPFSIRCFNPLPIPPVDCFYILSKGLNTGRPSFTPNVNCFVFTCGDSAELQQYYWLIYALWQGKKFHPHLCGSVVLFIHLTDLKKIITEAVAKVTNIGVVSAKMQQALSLEQQLEKQLAAVRQIKRCLLQASLIT